MASKGDSGAERPTTLKKEKGTVKSVLSGDTIVVLDDKPSTAGPPAEKIITLSSLQAPRFAGRNIEKDEDWAFESREFLRKKVVGKKIQYQVDHSTGTGRDYVTAYLAPVGSAEPECVNHSVVSEGWASVKESSKKGDQPSVLATLEDSAKQAVKGIHAKDKPTPLSKNDEDADTLFRQLKGKPLNAIVEQVRTGTSVKVTILPSRHTFQVLLSGAQAKGWKKQAGGDEPQPEPFAREAKFFVENHVLQRDITLTIEGIAPPSNNQQGLVLSGSIEFQGHDVAEELLKAGLASYVAYSAAPRGPEWVVKLKAAEKSAKDGKRRLFANYEAKSSNGGQAIGKEFVGKVTSIKNNGTIIVVPDGSTEEITVNFSSINVPRPPLEGEAKKAKEANKKEGEKEKDRLEEIADAHWAAEGKEVLRKRLIGQKVRVVHDYTKQGREKNQLPRDFHSVYQADQNLAVVLVESGLAKVNTFGPVEDRSADFEVLIMAEKKAQAAHRGVHLPVDKVPARRFHDLCGDNVEERVVFSGARYKLTVPKQTAILFFSLAGIRVPNRAESDEISNAAMEFSREKLHQLEVTIEVTGADKGGNFVGTLYIGKKNYSTLLVEAGLAEVHFSAERLKEKDELNEAQEAARAKKLNMWKNYDAEAERIRKEAERAERTGEKDTSPVQFGKPSEVIITEVLDGSRFYMQVVGPESAGLEELVTQLTELSVTEGSGLPLLTPKVGDKVRGQFSADERWYRAQVQEIKGDKYKLQYIDYGNTEVVPASKIRALPSTSDALPPQAQLANLAFIKPLKDDNESYADAKDDLRNLIEGKKLTATLEYKDGNSLYYTIAEGSENITALLLEAGNARLVHRIKRNYSNPTYVTLKAVEDEAKRRRKGIWYYGDVADSDEDEKDSNAPKKGGAKPAPSKDAKVVAPAAEKGGKKK